MYVYGHINVPRTIFTIFIYSLRTCHRCIKKIIWALKGIVQTEKGGGRGSKVVSVKKCQIVVPLCTCILFKNVNKTELALIWVKTVLGVYRYASCSLRICTDRGPMKRKNNLIRPLALQIRKRQEAHLYMHWLRNERASRYYCTAFFVARALSKQTSPFLTLNDETPFCDLKSEGRKNQLWMKSRRFVWHHSRPLAGQYL